MSLSVARTLRYPFATKQHQTIFWVLTLLGLIPMVGGVFSGSVATAAVSVISMERDEAFSLPTEELLTRAIRAFFAGLVTIFYLFPALIGFAVIGVSLFSSGDVTWPAVLLGLYGVAVLSALPLAVLHAVTTRSVWHALDLPRLVWLGLKIDFHTFWKILVVSVVLVFLKLSVGLLSFIGVGLLLAPVKAYAEYAFQYALAKSYSISTVGGYDGAR